MKKPDSPNKHRFGQPFPRTTPSPLLWRALKIQFRQLVSRVAGYSLISWGPRNTKAQRQVSFIGRCHRTTARKTSAISTRKCSCEKLATHVQVFQKTREGCGCRKFLAGKVFGQILTLLENSSPIFRQHEMLSLPRFGHFPARKTAAGKLAAPSGTLLDFLLRDRHSFLEFF